MSTGTIAPDLEPVPQLCTTCGGPLNHRHSGRGGRTVAHPRSPVVEGEVHYRIKMAGHNAGWKAGYPSDVERVIGNRAADVAIEGVDARLIVMEVWASCPNDYEVKRRTADLHVGGADEICHLAVGRWTVFRGQPAMLIDAESPFRVTGAYRPMGGSYIPHAMSLEDVVAELGAGRLRWVTVRLGGRYRGLWVSQPMPQLTLPLAYEEPDEP